MLDVIAKTVLESKDTLAQAFRSADPFPHVVIDGFFNEAFCKRLLAEFPPFASENARSEFGTVGGKAAYPMIRNLGGAYARADEVFQGQTFLDLIGDISGIDRLLYDPDYVGGGTHENVAGQELDPHVDFNYHPRTGWHRRLNLIVYLNPEWKTAWGGSLELHRDPWDSSTDRIKEILPVSNRAVLFETSERSWHGFHPITPPADSGISRRSLAIYLYSRERPEKEIAPDHSTVYVPRPLPVVVKPVAPLSSEDRNRLMRAIARRRDHIGLLSQRDLELGNQETEQMIELLRSAQGGLHAEDISALEDLLRRQDVTIRLLYDREQEHTRARDHIRDLRSRFGIVSLSGAPARVISLEGIWIDRWAGRNVTMTLEVQTPIRAMTIRGYVPEALLGSQKLICKIDGAMTARSFEPGEFRWKVPLTLGTGESRQIEIHATSVFCPAKVASSRDQRELAFVVDEVALEA